MFLRDQGLNPFGKQSVRIDRARVRCCFAQIGIFLVLQGLAGRAIGGPVLLVLIQMQHSFEDGYEHSQSARDPGSLREAERCDEGNQGCGYDFDYLDALESALVDQAFPVVPGDFLLEALDDRIRCAGLGISGS